MPVPGPVPRRRDARRNRAAILEAAVEALATGRTPVPLQEIARRAGIGQATVYRHFPDRHALAAEVVRGQLQTLKQAAADNAHRPEMFRWLLEAVLRTQISMRPLVDLLRHAPPDVRSRYARQVVSALAEPLRRAQQAGLVRAEVTADDLLLIMVMMEGVLDAFPGDAGRASAERAAAVVLDGLFVGDRRDGCAGPATPTAGP